MRKFGYARAILLGVFLGFVTVLSSSGVQTQAQVPSIEILKSDSPDPVAAGDTVTYSISVTLSSGAAQHNVTIDDVLPPGFTLVAGGVSGEGCTAIPCNVGTLAPPQTKTVQVIALVDPAAAPITYTNSASATSDESGPVLDDEDTTVSESAVLVLTKTDSFDPATAGSTLTYSIDILNNGPSNADNILFSDSVPTSLTSVSVLTSPSNLNTVCGVDLTNTVTCSNVGDFAVGGSTLSPGASATVTITGTVSPNTASGTVLTNQATADSTEPNPAVQSNVEMTTVITSADLSVTKTDSPDPVEANEVLTYTVTVGNAGPSDSQNVVVTDDLPPGTSFIAASSSPECVPDSVDPLEIECSTASVAAGGSVIYTIATQVGKVDGSTIFEGATLANNATVASDTPDPNSANDAATETTAVIAPDLSLTKSSVPASGTEISPGQTITFTIAYANTGSADATSAVITDVVSNLLGAITPSAGGAFDPATRTLTWSLGTVPKLGDPGSSGSVSFIATPGATNTSQDIDNEASITALELVDPVTSNVTTHHLVPPDLELDKSSNRASNSIVKPFDLVIYELEIRNRRGTAVSVIVTDSPPPHMGYAPGTTRVDGVLVSDVVGTSPLFAGGLDIGTLNRNDRRVVTFEMSVLATAPAGSLLENWGYATWNLGTRTTGDFFRLRVFTPTLGPTLRQSILVQGPTGRTIFVTVFNTTISLLPVTGYQGIFLLVIGLSAFGFGRSLASRIRPDLLRETRDE